MVGASHTCTSWPVALGRNSRCDPRAWPGGHLRSERGMTHRIEQASTGQGTSRKGVVAQANVRSTCTDSLCLTAAATGMAGKRRFATPASKGTRGRAGLGYCTARTKAIVERSMPAEAAHSWHGNGRVRQEDMPGKLRHTPRPSDYDLASKQAAAEKLVPVISQVGSPEPSLQQA